MGLSSWIQPPSSILSNNYNPSPPLSSRILSIRTDCPWASMDRCNFYTGEEVVSSLPQQTPSLCCRGRSSFVSLLGSVHWNPILCGISINPWLWHQPRLYGGHCTKCIRLAQLLNFRHHQNKKSGPLFIKHHPQHEPRKVTQAPP